MLRIAPCETLKFLACNNNEVGVHFTCTNSCPIIYKIQTTSPEKFRVRPRCGFLEPKQTVHISILLKPEYQLAESPKDKFLVLSTRAPLDMDLSTTQRISDAWKLKFGNVNCPGIEQHRLTCSYESKEQLPLVRSCLPDELSDYVAGTIPRQSINGHTGQSINGHTRQSVNGHTRQSINGHTRQSINDHPRQSINSQGHGQGQGQGQGHGHGRAFPYDHGRAPITDHSRIAPSEHSRAFNDTYTTAHAFPDYPIAVTTTATTTHSSSRIADRKSGENMEELTKKTTQMEKQVRLTQVLQYLTLFVLLIVSAGVIFFVHYEMRSGGEKICLTPVPSVPQQSPSLPSKFRSTFRMDRFKRQPCPEQ